MSTQPTDAPEPKPAGAPKPEVTKAQSQRMRQTGKAIFYSVLATLVIVLAVLALNPQRDHSYDPGVEVAVTAEEVADVAEFTPVQLQEPQGWRANYARWYSPAQNDVAYWSVGYLTEDDEFFGFDQTVDANPTWVASMVKEGENLGETQILEHDFDIYLAENGHHYLVGEIPGGEKPVTLITNGSLPEEQLGEYTAELVDQITN